MDFNEFLIKFKKIYPEFKNRIPKGFKNENICKEIIFGKFKIFCWLKLKKYPLYKNGLIIRGFNQNTLNKLLEILKKHKKITEKP